MSAHDQVANKEYPLQSVASSDSKYGAKYLKEEALRIVCIEKKTDPLVCDSEDTFKLHHVNVKLWTPLPLAVHHSCSVDSYDMSL